MWFCSFLLSLKKFSVCKLSDVSIDRTFNLQHVSNVIQEAGTPVTTDTECLLQVCLGLVVRSLAAEAVGTWNVTSLLSLSWRVRLRNIN